LTGFAACAVEPPLAAREIPNAAPNATTATATPSATSLATPDSVAPIERPSHRVGSIHTQVQFR
jgi:hypothetical protein